MSHIQTRYLSRLHNWMNQLEEGNKHPAFSSEMSVVEHTLNYIKDMGIENPVFCDLGCSTGNVLFTAKEILGKEGEYYGIDHNGTYLAAARAIDWQFKLHPIDLFSKISKDIMEKSDIIFTYVPIGGADMVKLYKIISLKAKPGALIIINDLNFNPEYFSTQINIEPIKRFEGTKGCCDQTDIRIFRKL